MKTVNNAPADGRLPYPYEGDSAPEAMLAEILNALHWNAAVPLDHIKVELHNGVVVLTGSVADAYARDLAVKHALAVRGVVEVINQIVISS